MKNLRTSIIAGVTLSAAVVLALASTTSAFAVFGCRTDPTVMLSNGYNVQMWNQIDTDISNVTSVDVRSSRARGSIRDRHILR